jgi:hypothetical protein
MEGGGRTVPFMTIIGTVASAVGEHPTASRVAPTSHSLWTTKLDHCRCSKVAQRLLRFFLDKQLLYCSPLGLVD